MEAIIDLIKSNPLFSTDTAKIREEIKEKQALLRSYKCVVEMTYEEFKQLISINAYKIMLQRSINRDYIIDKTIEPVILNLYRYFTNDPNCTWNLNAGLLFAGKPGCGKSLLLTSFFRLSNEYSRKITTMTHGKTLASLIKTRGGIEYLSRCPLFIDELGREQSEVKDWGNVLKPIIDLFALRYEEGGRTYGTTNFNFDSLQDFYGEFIRTRMEEMMTFVIVPGVNRRLKNEITNPFKYIK